MGKYIVKSGQNLYDVALDIYGSIEGVVDLMISNPALSLAGTINMNDELLFTDLYSVNPTVAKYLDANNLTPSNGSRSVSLKSPTLLPMAVIITPKDMHAVSFVMQGAGNMQIDWGDNSELQSISLSLTSNDPIEHRFDNQILDNRKIRLYGSVAVTICDLSNINSSAIYLIKPLPIESLIISHASLAVDFFGLLSGIYGMHLPLLDTTSLLPLLKNTELMTLNLSNAVFDRSILDEYLIQLVAQYGGRRSCTVTLTTEPSGIYQQPQRDGNLEYIITSGMEAIWVITHEPEWNAGGLWKFIINNTTYTA